IQRPETVQVPEQDRGIKTIHIPKTITAAPFLQHPGLTPGQKRFLYSIAEAYSKEHMRQLICQHYMNVLHRCIRTEEPKTNSQSTSTSKTKEKNDATCKNAKTLLKEIAVILIFNYYTEYPLDLQNQTKYIQEREGLPLQNMLRHGVGLLRYRLQIV
uniref:Uncharacterized protein n=1 Tax=Sinocyclocheilus grahami TaxID=75366 RepID=A0A672NBS5_SINGR